MTVDPTALLRQLGQTGRVGAASGASAASSAENVQAGEFADLLKRARDGTLSSTRPVTIEEGSGVTLSDDQLARLSLAADRAEAAGLRKALVMIDDQRVIIDVQQRTVIGAANTQSGVLEGIDGVLDLAGVLSPASPKAAPLGPPSSFENPSITRLMSQRNEAERAA